LPPVFGAIVRDRFVVVTTKLHSKAQGNSLSATGSAANEPAALLKLQQLVRAINASRFEKELLAYEVGLVDKRALSKAISLSPRMIEILQGKRLIPVVRLSPRCVRYSISAVVAALRRFEQREVS
jgi:hypothetical protein